VAEGESLSNPQAMAAWCATRPPRGASNCPWSSTPTSPTRSEMPRAQYRDKSRWGGRASWWTLRRSQSC